MDKPSKARTPAPQLSYRSSRGEVGVFVKFLFPLGCRRGFFICKIFLIGVKDEK